MAARCAGCQPGQKRGPRTGTTDGRGEQLPLVIAPRNTEFGASSIIGKLDHSIDIANGVLRQFREYLVTGQVEATQVVELGTAVEQARLAIGPLNQPWLNVSHEINNQRIQSALDNLSLSQIISNLFVNAASVGRQSQQTIQVEISYSANDQYNYILVKNDGPAISDAIVEVLFEPGRHSSTGSTGIGLALGRTILRNVGGELRLATAHPWPSRSFCLNLPSTPTLSELKRSMRPMTRVSNGLRCKSLQFVMASTLLVLKLTNSHSIVAGGLEPTSYTTGLTASVVDSDPRDKTMARAPKSNQLDRN